MTASDTSAADETETTAGAGPVSIEPLPGQDGSAPRDDPDNGFQKPDAKLIALTRIVAAACWSVVGAVAAPAGCGLWSVIPYPTRLLIPLVWLSLAAAAAVGVVWWPRWEHARWSFRVGDKIVQLRHGVVWHLSVSIPITRLQHVDVHRGPLERRCGLASLVIHTAGTRDASHRIPGVDVEIAHTLRDQLIEAAHRGTNEHARG